MGLKTLHHIFLFQALKRRSLGIPLPVGVLRVYKADSEGQLQSPLHASRVIFRQLYSLSERFIMARAS